MEPEPTQYVLHFKELPAKGLEVVVRAGSVRERLAFDRMRFADAGTLEAVTAKEEKILQTLAARLVSWDLTRDGQPVEPSYEALLDLEDPMAQQIVSGWIEAITGAPEPGKAPEGPMDSIPMSSIEDSAPQ